MNSLISASSNGDIAQHATAKYLCAARGPDLPINARAAELGCSVGHHEMTAKSKLYTDLHDSRSSNYDSNARASTVKPKKSVRWATITVHEFGVGLGGSAVSSKGGPSIGLADTPEFTWTTRVGEMAECVEGVHRFTPGQRIRLLQAAGIPDGIITRHARETNIILGSRRRSKTSWKDGELDEEDERKVETYGRLPKKRSAEQALLEHPRSIFLRRPRMIAVNYV
ncbi:uncharacterized protein PHALS_00936 [Plasmopara halstedii]|uniref:Uncharacterized protein n=1 Tax=Plasmopara halstedii TaxID=4781 RepID=A0A0P1AS27_PLAHL|nr:uncharacterized protein PHALS_00936 [Plasmopara halstedii]CEG44586.1 hypothetical protein PHALS_00936 [Plasmopara halstedii]|eukprot:XP_024580955.1 hypothetical protein PHALS_00936 [Plasmopara halstedii]